MQQYFTIEGTPLKYHKFFHYFSLPFTFFGNIVGLVMTAMEMGTFNWGYTIDFTYCFLIIVLTSLCFIGFFKWKPYAWYGVMLMQGLTLLYFLLLVFLAAFYSYGQLSDFIVCLIGSTIIDALICIYYYKRKPLFFQPEQPAQQPVFTAPAAPTPPVSASPACFCGNCGCKLLPDSIFCSECGTRIQ